MRPLPRKIYRHVGILIATVLATVFALSCAWEFKLEVWMMHALGIDYEQSFESAERWRFILTSTAFAAIALIIPSIWLGRSLRIQKDGYLALRREQALSNELARRDPLTGLLNRRVFHEQLAAALERTPCTAAIFLIDLDRFKSINDSHGHAVGDKVLCEVAQRLSDIGLQSKTCVARIGGDEFALLVDDDNKRSLSALAKRILTSFFTPLESLTNKIVVGATIGISIAPIDAVHPDTLMHCADHAMYRGKRAGRATFHFYDPSYEDAEKPDSEFESDLILALKLGRIEPFFQPVVNLPGRTVVGFEILARWRCPHRGLQMPTEFVPVLDRLGLIPEMTFLLLKRSIVCAAQWPDELVLAINVTASMLEDAGFADRLYDEIIELGFAPARLEIEITEHALVSKLSVVRDNLLKLRSWGIRVALDDFGTGYSGIYHLTHLAIDKIKVDRSFLDWKIAGHEKIVSAVLGLASSLQIKTTAEGVEDEDVFRWLCTQPCDFAQGYLFGKPMPANDVSALFQNCGDVPDPQREKSANVKLQA
ncbi:putative bifunctional diguanylate cyclase/phosphodiesterase [Paraburkholderia tropica]|uniref:putative bifunctional diguanylate cyclase/phosphodiesterase n=1 Tax=Paraburkholderia tropica TaxID=92647 RepID=UPI00191E8684|nr:EAL domain-containing protein [Paraburkholderia tropica]